MRRSRHRLTRQLATAPLRTRARGVCVAGAVAQMIAPMLSPMIALVVVVGMANVDRAAQADTITLQDGRVVEGRVRSDRDGEPVKFRAYGMTLEIPRERIRGEIEKTRRDNITVPGGNAEADEFCEAGDAFLKNGDVDDAYHCFVQAFERDPTHARAARGALRAAIEGSCGHDGIAEAVGEARERWFNLDLKLRLGDFDDDDERDDLAHAVERSRAEYERVLDRFEPYKRGLAELIEFAGWLTLATALELRKEHAETIETATDALADARQTLRKIVEDAADDDLSARELEWFAARVDAYRDEVRVLSAAPGSPEALLRLRDYAEEVHVLLALVDVAERFDEAVADSLAVLIADWTGEWRAALPVSAVTSDPGGERATLNAGARAQNDVLLSEAVDDGELTEAGKAAFIALNDYRELMGSMRLLVDSTLMRACRAHLSDLAGQQTLSHEGRNGSTPSKRAEAAGFPLGRNGSIGENLFQGDRDLRDAEVDEVVATVLRAWLHSPTHHLNLLRDSHTFMGIAATRHSQRWAALMGSRG